MDDRVELNASVLQTGVLELEDELRLVGDRWIVEVDFESRLMKPPRSIRRSKGRRSASVECAQGGDEQAGVAVLSSLLSHLRDRVDQPARSEPFRLRREPCALSRSWIDTRQEIERPGNVGNVELTGYLRIRIVQLGPSRRIGRIQPGAHGSR